MLRSRPPKATKTLVRNFLETSPHGWSSLCTTSEMFDLKVRGLWWCTPLMVATAMSALRGTLCEIGEARERHMAGN